MTRISADDAAIQSRRERVARLYLQGMTQQEIAQREKAGQATICRDLQAIRRAWKDSAVRDFDEGVSRELDRIDLLERTYWQAWERSTQERTRSRTRRRTGRAASDEASVEREQRDGNPAFLDGVMRCIEQRCKLLGIPAPAPPAGANVTVTVVGGIDLSAVVGHRSGLHHHANGSHN